MTKETKQDRIVRQMFDNMSEHLHELKTIEANPNSKENDVERWAQSFLKSCLGFSATNGYTIRAQEQKGKQRPDLVIYEGEKPVLVVEVKKLGYNFNKSDFRSGKVQLQEYLYSLGTVKYGFLCNGFEWKLIDFTNSAGAIDSLSFDLRNDENKIDTGKRFVEELCYDFVCFHESSYKSKEWDEYAKEATAFSPESLTRAILSSNVIKYIAKEIKGEHEYKANIDSLAQKVYTLLSTGLDDSLKDFNDVKKLEFQKYIKSQLRQSRRIKKSPKKDSASEANAPTATQVELPIAVIAEGTSDEVAKKIA